MPTFTTALTLDFTNKILLLKRTAFPGNRFSLTPPHTPWHCEPECMFLQHTTGVPQAPAS